MIVAGSLGSSLHLYSQYVIETSTVHMNAPIKMYMGLLIAIVFLNSASTSIWLDNMRSKDGSAIESGRLCLSAVGRHYFKSSSITRTLNMAIMHAGNLSSPAAEIENTYLLWLHRSIASGEFDE